MIYTDMTKRAMKLMFEAHRDQTDKGGLPYVFHPFHVAEQMSDELTTTVALLHDVAEDSDYTLKDIENMGFDSEVVTALALLTHDEAVSYFDYIKSIRQNKTARLVKIADLRHNSDVSRLDKTDEYVLSRVKKYEKAIQLLEQTEVN